MTTPKNIRVTTYLKGHPRAKVLKAIWDNTPKKLKRSFQTFSCIRFRLDYQHWTSLKHLDPEQIERLTPTSFKLNNPTYEWMAASETVDASKPTDTDAGWDKATDSGEGFPTGVVIDTAPLRTTEANELTISYETLDRLGKQLRRPRPMRRYELARLYAHITNGWQGTTCTVITLNGQDKVKVCHIEDLGS